MNIHQHNTANFRTVIKLLGIVAFLFFLTPASYGQNTKGDRAEVGGRSNQRQTRFKTKSQKRNKPKPGSHRVNPHKFSVARIARSLGIAQKSNKNVYSKHDRRYVNNKHQKPVATQTPWHGSSESTQPVKRPAGRSRNIYTQRYSYFKSHKIAPNSKQKAWNGTSSGSRLVVRSNTSKVSSEYTQSPQYSNNPSPQPKNVQHPPGKKRKIIPRSASSSFTHFKTLNTNAGFWNVKKKTEVAVTTDIAGRPLRTKNYRTPIREVIAPSNRRYSTRTRIGDHPSKVTGGARYVTATKTTPKAWNGDITGRKIRGRNFTSKPHEEDNLILPFRMLKARYGDKSYRGVIPGGGNNSVSNRRKRVSALYSKMPGLGSKGIATFQGNVKGFRPIHGGGSRSGRFWNNNGTAILTKLPKTDVRLSGSFQGNIKVYKPVKGGGSISGTPWNNKGNAVIGKQPKAGAEQIGSFQGNTKGYKPIRGGGSISGRTWNNKGKAVAGEPPSGRAQQVGTFQGNIKAYKPAKGGGSISGKPWNNKGTAVVGEQPIARIKRIGTFQGNIRAFKPLKGGGSISGRPWNNNGVAVTVKQPGVSAQGTWTFSGDIKSKKPKKGGGSISGKVWNNKTTPTPVRTPPLRAAQIGGFPGKIKMFEQNPGFINQGEEFTGYIKLPRYNKVYIQKDNTAEQSLKKRRPNETTYAVDNLQVKVKRRDYVVNKNSAKAALLKLEPTKNTLATENFHIKVKRRDYVANKNSAKAALLKLEPTKNTLATEDLHIKVKQYKYIHNSSSSHDALNVREPGKAFAKATDFQGNIKMKRFDLTKLFSQKYNEMHPDAKFVKINKNNVAAERDLLTNIKLWWARNFRKNDNQPDHLKEKEHKPRYDKGEQGLWNE